MDMNPTVVMDPRGEMFIRLYGCQKIIPSQVMGRDPARRLDFYRLLIKAGEYPDLRAAATGMALGLALERSKNLALQRTRYRVRLECKDDRRWRLAAAQVPPGACAYCNATDAVTIDHVIPRARGGPRSDLANLARCCRRCNEQKNNRTPGEWKAWRLAKGLPWPPAWAHPNDTHHLGCEHCNGGASEGVA